VIPAVSAVADALSIPPEWLHRLIQFESNFNPRAKNPRSTARGLIQFTDGTARGLGFADSADLVALYPDVDSQLRGPVLRYLKKYAPYPTEQSLHMAVFYPAARNWLPAQVFPDTVRAVNPGISTPADYMRKVYFRAGLNYIPVVGLFLLGIASIYILSKGV
jgi:hypothetical protein